MPTLADLLKQNAQPPAPRQGGLLGMLAERAPQYAQGVGSRYSSLASLLSPQAWGESMRGLPALAQQAMNQPPMSEEDRKSSTMAFMDKAMQFAPLGMITYHGSPHKFDKFDMSKVGTGNAGGTSFGLGINLSEDVRHASAYKGEKGNLYKVDLPDAEIKNFLRWEQKVPTALKQELPPVDMTKPLPFGGGAYIENAGGQWVLKTGNSKFRLSDSEVERMFGDAGTGEQVYRRLIASLGGDERAASKWLNERGYKGMANNTERGAANYVVFDDQIPKIVGRE